MAGDSSASQIQYSADRRENSLTHRWVYNKQNIMYNESLLDELYVIYMNGPGMSLKDTV